MGNQISYDFTNKSLTEKDFEFLSNYELEIKKVEEQISLQRLKRDELVQYINVLNRKISDSPNIDSKQYETLIEKATAVFNSADDNIKALYRLQNDLVTLDKNIVDFLLRFKTGNSQNYSENEINEIKENISMSSEVFSKIQKDLILNNIKIDNFMKQFSLQNFSHNTHTPAPEPVKAASRSSVQPKADTLEFYDNNIGDVEDNNTLLIREKTKTVLLPYTKKEIEEYYKQYSGEYKSYSDVVKKEFVLPLDSYTRHPTIARFREGYSLIRDKEAKSIFDALKYGLDLMFRSDLYPAIIPACKSEDVLNDYIQCLEEKSLESFKAFEIKFEVSPLKKY